MNIDVTLADYQDTQTAQAIGSLLNNYACDPMGGATPLPQSIIDNLATELAKRPHAFSIICYVDGAPAGLMNCFEGFSTFKCKPLINIHDIFVAPPFRGLGISQMMLKMVEEQAQARGCCKLTLEVLDGNKTARQAYQKFGFKGYELSPEVGKALFWQKEL
jgi:GNAT superfamily N-acetyltransferase